MHLRIDTIEAAIRAGNSRPQDVGPTGYMVAYALAEENLRLGRTVVADSVNPLKVTRDAWRSVAERASMPAVEIEIIRSDPQDHRRVVETRVNDIEGLTPPTWADVVGRDYEPWDRPRTVIDTSFKTLDECVRELEWLWSARGLPAPQ
jgi:predicted kinase